ncbi:hypothetical protein Tco_0053236 [Tanacetum coccineum]
MDQTILKSHVEKPEKFKWSDFRHWQQKMLFYLTSFHVSYVLTDSEPTNSYLVDGENIPTETQITDYEKAFSQWNHNEYNCRRYILNALNDSLYDIYSTIATASFEHLVLKICVEEDNMMNEKANANSIELNANMVGESSSKTKSNHKTKAKVVVVLHRNIIRMERRITPNKINTTSRKSIIVGSVGNLGTKLSVVPFECKGFRVYKFNLDYVANIKWVVELPFNARLLSSTSISFSRLVNFLEVKHFISTSVKGIDIVQLGIVSQAGLMLLLRSSLVSAPPHN